MILLRSTQENITGDMEEVRLGKNNKNIALELSSQSCIYQSEVRGGSMRCPTGTNILKISALRPVWRERILTK